MLSYKGYFGEAEFDNEAKVFYGRVINVRDKITFQSDDAKRLEQEFCASVDTYLEFCREMGEEPEEPLSEEFVLRISPKDHREIALAAQIANKSLNAWAAENLIESAHRALR